MSTREENPDESCSGREEPAGSIVRTVFVFSPQSLEHCVAHSRHAVHIYWMDREASDCEL